MKYFDLHCDTVTECYDHKNSLYENENAVSLKKGEAFETWAQVFAIWIDDKKRGEEAWHYFSDTAAFFAEEMRKSSEKTAFCRTARELREADAAKKEIALLAIEGGSALAGKMQYLQQAYEAGVRMITLTWNARCETADGCMVKDAGGLAPFGFELVKEMNRLKMVVDVSHLSEKGFWDVARVSERPFVATHSDSKAACDCPRNLTDEQFREIVHDGGLVGINFCREFLNESGKADLNDILRHVDHFLNLGGEKVIAVGSDFDGCTVADGISGLENVDVLYNLLAGEFGRATADDIFYNNTFRFFTENLE